MTDTPKNIQRLYADVFCQKTDRERFKIGFQMMKDGRNMVTATPHQQHPDWSETELKIGMFTRIYGRDLTPKQVADIIKSSR